VAALLLAAVDSTSVHPGVTLPANHLVAVVFPCQHGKRRLNDTTSQPQDKVEGRFLLDVVITQRASVLQLLPCKDKTLLIWGNPLLVLDLRLHIVDGIGCLDIKSDGLTSQSFDEDLHGG